MTRIVGKMCVYLDRNCLECFYFLIFQNQNISLKEKDVIFLKSMLSSHASELDSQRKHPFILQVFNSCDVALNKGNFGLIFHNIILVSPVNHNPDKTLFQKSCNRKLNKQTQCPLIISSAEACHIHQHHNKENDFFTSEKIKLNHTKFKIHERE